MVSRGKSFGKGRKGNPPTYKIVKRPLPPEGIEVQQARREQELEGARERERLRKKREQESLALKTKVLEREKWLSDNVRKWKAEAQSRKTMDSMYRFRMVLHPKVQKEFVALHDKFQTVKDQAQANASECIEMIGEAGCDTERKDLLEEVSTLENNFTTLQSAFKAETRRVVVKSEQLKLQDSRKKMSGWVEHFSVTFAEDSFSASLFKDLHAYWKLLAKGRSNLQEELQGFDRLKLDLRSLSDKNERNIIAKKYDSMKQQLIESQVEYEDYVVQKLEFADTATAVTM